MAVQSTPRGYECLPLEDATESHFPEFKRAAIEMLAAQGAIGARSAPPAGIKRRDMPFVRAHHPYASNIEKRRFLA